MNVEQSAPPLGLRALELARGEVGVRETAPNRGPRVEAYQRGCVRAGMRPGFAVGLEWCAAFVSWCVYHAAWTSTVPGVRPYDDPEAVAAARASTWLSDDPGTPVGWRAAVSELVQDARATGVLRLPQSAEEPREGDLLIYGRAGGSPLRNGRGHVGVCSAWGDRMAAICGNDGDAVREVELGPDGEHPSCGPLLAWIRLG
jgi:hypothetical protein